MKLNKIKFLTFIYDYSRKSKVGFSLENLLIDDGCKCHKKNFLFFQGVWSFLPYTDRVIFTWVVTRNNWKKKTESDIIEHKVNGTDTNS